MPDPKDREDEELAPQPAAPASEVARFETKIEHSNVAAVANGSQPSAQGTVNMQGATFHVGTMVIAGATAPGATPGTPASPPTPSYLDAETRLLSEKLADAEARKQRLQEHGADMTEVVQEILSIKRQLREGGRLKPGDTFGDGRYLLLESVGQGDFSTVWRAHDRKLGEDVALKVLHPNWAGNQARLERFRQGAQVMSELRHEAVVRVLDPCREDGGWHFLVMEHMRGRDLASALHEGRIGREQVLPLMLKVCDAVSLMHSRGMMHRNINPTNVLLNGANEPKITSFDWAGGPPAIGTDRAGMPRALIYIDPRYADHPDKADARSDVYSLGVTILVALRGAEPPTELYGRLEALVPWLREGFAVKEVLSRAIRLEHREDRFADAGAFRDALQEAMKYIRGAKKVVRAAITYAHRLVFGYTVMIATSVIMAACVFIPVSVVYTASRLLGMNWDDSLPFAIMLLVAAVGVMFAYMQIMRWSRRQKPSAWWIPK